MYRNDEFRELLEFVKRMYFYDRRDFEILRGMWTTYCLHWKLNIDTADYDNDMHCLFNFVRATASKADGQNLDPKKMKRLRYSGILLFLGLYINEIAGKPVLYSLRSG